MTVSVWAPLLLPLLLAPLLALPSMGALPDLLPPRAAAWLLTATAAGLSAAGAAALALLSVAALLHLPFVAAVGHLDLPVARHLAPGAVVPVGAAAALVLVVLAVRALRVLRRHRAEHAEARLLVALHAGAGAGDLIVLPDRLPDAYALPGGLFRGGRDRIVVTAGMIEALPADEREVLLAHERAHLTGRHHRFLLLADLAVALHPLLRPLRDGAAYSLERWADESAAERVADRRLVARAVGRAALAGAGAGALRMAAGPVPRRVAAMLECRAAPRRRRASLLAAAVLAGALGLSLGTTLDAASDLHEQVEAAQSAPWWHGPHGAHEAGDRAAGGTRDGAVHGAVDKAVDRAVDGVRDGAR
ncbi:MULTISPECIES: M48 family metalloprotease [Streptacidiphilus]|uniref:M48 family metalloprotease n=1 Tax=Streptacidiphilus cavernicola TaxID=3342716 RepID=A0ABV6UQA2_9ACTN|nr:M48 family metalloprotease [Streptacidiphilus jeojiense]